MSSSKRCPFHFRLLVLSVVAVFGPFWLYHLRLNVSQTLMQHTPLLALAAGVLAIQRIRAYSDSKQQVAVNLHFIVWGFLGIACLACAIYLPSNWLGSFGGILSLWSLAWAYGGKPFTDRLRSSWALLFLCLPVPFNWAQIGISRLQQLATWLASTGLDLIGVRHVPYGVTVQSAKNIYFVEEACSGVNSLFAALAAVGFYLAYKNFSTIRSLVLLTLTLGWVVFANALRVFLIVMLDINAGFDLTSGIAHEFLGYGTFLFALAMAISSERLVQFIVPLPKRNAAAEFNKSTGYFAPLTHLWFGNWSTSNSVVASLSALLIISHLSLLVPTSKLLFAQSQTPIEFHAAIDKDFNNASLLPASIDDWNVTNFERKDRSKLAELFGATSLVWTIEKDDHTAVVSIDGMFRGWHDVSKCYKNSGWNIAQYEHLRTSASDFDNIVELRMRRGTQEYGMVVFGLLNQKGKYTPAPDAYSVWNRQQLKNEAAEGLYQVQILCERKDPIDPDLADEIHELFRHIENIFANTLESRIKGA